jgi:hypothetical protein
MTIKEKKREKKKSSKKRLRSDSVVLSDNDQPLNNSKERGMDVGTINVEGGVAVTGKKLMVVDDTTDKQRIEKREKKKSKVSKKEGFHDTHKVSKANHHANSGFQESNVTDPIVVVDEEVDNKEISKPNEKKKKKKKKKKDSNNEAKTSSKQDKISSSREEKKKEKASWLQKVPTIDEKTGKSYSKMQIRHMLKRVKKGLPALLTEEEERKLEKERRRAKEQEKREFQEFMEDSENDDGDDDNAEEEEEDIASGEEKEGNEQLRTATHQKDEENTRSPKQMSHKLRSKPVPSDYVCQACKNTHKPPHWIYDCPHKVTVRGTNQVAKPLRGHIEPDIQHKVFVSGLPFGITHKAVEEFFRQRCCNSKKHHVLDKEDADEHSKGKKKDVTCKLVLFSDSSKCRGLAYVTFENEQMTMEALKLDGIHWPSEQDSDDKNTRRWLKISRMKSKIETKKIASQRKWRERMKQQGAHAKHNKMSTS